MFYNIPGYEFDDVESFRFKIYTQNLTNPFNILKGTSSLRMTNWNEKCNTESIESGKVLKGWFTCPNAALEAHYRQDTHS